MRRMTAPSPAWLPALERALAADDVAALVAIPKADLHCHGLLSAPLESYEAVLGRRLPRPPRIFGDFDSFGQYIVEHLYPALATLDGVRAIIRGAFERLIADGVVYAEMSFDLLTPEALGISVEQFAAALREEIARVAPSVELAPEIGLNRALPAEDIAPLLRTWLATGVFGSIDLYGDERVGDLRDFAPLYDLAAAHGLKRKAHAGELCGPDAVRQAVEILGVMALQHGVRAAEDPATAAWLAERGIVLHLCPTSECALGICASLEDHPARQLFDRGVALTVNTDDFTLFGASACDELRALAHLGFTAAEIATFIERGLAERNT